MRNINKFIVLNLALFAMVSCIEQDKNDPGVEYAPQMYVSTPYEPYTQVDLNSINPMGINMRKPAENTVSRQMNDGSTLKVELMAKYPYSQDSLEFAALTLRNPIKNSLDTNLLAEGKVLYSKYCTPCHGEAGDGQGTVGKVYGGVANLKSVADKPEGHIYHVITMGKGRMWPHGSQILPLDRWKIVSYVNQLRGYTSSVQASLVTDSIK